MSEKEVKIENELTSNMEDYIETISILSSQNKVVRVKDIAKSLNIKMPSVTAALIKLKEKSLISYEKYGYVELTASGKKEANRIYDRHSLLTTFLNEVLSIGPAQSDNEACRLEHHMTADTFQRFTRFMEFYHSEKNKGAAWCASLENYLKK